MKKIPSLFVRDRDGNRSLVTREVNPECGWVEAGEGVPTRKRDGTACLVRDGVLFRRYDAKPGRTPPPGFESCQDPVPETGHAPGWVPIGDGPADRWYRTAFDGAGDLPNGTYELCGPHFNTNPEGVAADIFILHGSEVLPDGPRYFDEIRRFLGDTRFEPCIEGIVWHHPDGRMAKIKARDLGLKWPREEDVEALRRERDGLRALLREIMATEFEDEGGWSALTPRDVLDALLVARIERAVEVK